MAKRQVIVLGAASPMGQAFVEHLAASGHSVSAFYHGQRTPRSSSINWVSAAPPASLQHSAEVGRDMDVFVDLTAKDPTLSRLDTEALAHSAVDFITSANIPNVVIVSSIAASVLERKETQARRQGMGNLAAEDIYRQRLTDASKLVILRPPAIYGPHIRNSFSMLASMVRSGMPIPLGSATALRHYISKRNLCDLLETVISCDEQKLSNASGKIFEPSDNSAVSTRGLVEMIAATIGRKPFLVSVPVQLLRAVGSVTGGAELVSGAVDGLNVAPPVELEQAFGWRPLEKMPDSLAFLRRPTTGS